ncbi:mitochondrial inner membrane protein OXA1-like isoform X3 [Juglans microcarpa x Juglans regia]|uniref:mitochondrial inner membrane protein OXA1-like isoform X2 n=1 Tax=Juglans microcarpa x Juglans regia TaxID=2249226 RepID=UPI001B7E0372|nr:mitochondrial inner membrane protein OXA1-like isoform X2 [Juglans microcarpa x Juglans regia]XP_040987234.1 mitochondrial inner membrane protein OXA1-like isoform X3 [Juglans microcarpa x Juglans regia]
MAYMRSLSTRATFIARRCHPSFTYVLHDDDRKHYTSVEDLSPQRIDNFVQRRRSFGSSSFNKLAGFVPFLPDRGCSHVLLPSSFGPSFHRYMSTTVGDGSEKIEIMSDVAGVLTDTTVEAVASQASAVNEVAIAAADSFLPVQALQYLIDAVHSFTGLNWWASIALTTLLIRGATLPLLINQLKATAKLTLLRPHLEELKQQMQDKGMEPAEGQQQMQKLFKEYGVSPFTPLKGLLIQGPVFISFFLAISNMAEKVPSFKGGGAYWFVDLTTPDSLYIFPLLTAVTFLVTVECNMQEGMEGNPVAGTMKNVSRGIAVLTVPFTMSFPKAIFCYWVTSNLFSLVYGLALKNPGVKKFLGVPEMPVAQPPTAPQPAFSAFSALQRPTVVKQEPTPIPPESVKRPDQRISSSSLISQRLRSLEKQVKGRKKTKKR